jgi:hypothetical protein
MNTLTKAEAQRQAAETVDSLNISQDSTVCEPSSGLSVKPPHIDLSFGESSIQPLSSPVSTYVSGQTHFSVASLSLIGQDRFNWFQTRPALMNKLTSLAQVQKLDLSPVPQSIDSDASHW